MEANTNPALTPYAKRLLNYAMAYSPFRPVRKGKRKAEIEAQRMEWAVDFLDKVAPGWQGRKRQPKAGTIVIEITAEDEE